MILENSQMLSVTSKYLGEIACNFIQGGKKLSGFVYCGIYVYQIGEWIVIDIVLY